MTRSAWITHGLAVAIVKQLYRSRSAYTIEDAASELMAQPNGLTINIPGRVGDWPRIEGYVPTPQRMYYARKRAAELL